jgi:hypothetical protein
MIKRRIFIFLIISLLGLLVVLGFNQFTYSTSIVAQEYEDNETKSEVSELTVEEIIKTFSVNNLEEADRKTREIIQANQDFYSGPGFDLLSCQLIKKIDQEWLLITNNRFGFSPQYKIWQKIKKIEKDPDKQVKMLGDRLGWTRKQPLTEPEFISPDWLYGDELNYSLQAPRGHLPWVGINSEIIRDMAANAGPGCGSCTIDAMNLQGDRFYRYIPDLFKRFQECL